MNRLRRAFDTVKDQGRQWGAFFRQEGRGYGKPYPSNPYHPSDPRHAEYEAGYDEGFAA